MQECANKLGVVEASYAFAIIAVLWRARAAAQVRQVVHVQTFGDFPQPGSASGEETAEQPARGQLVQPRLPVLGVAAQPLEDAGQFTEDHSLALAKQPTGVLHQEQVIAQRESFHHSFACRIQPPSILE